MTRILILFLISIQAVFGQIEYKEGWVILNSGEKKTGKIHFKNTKSAQRKCIFLDVNEGKKVFYPNQIKEYGIKEFKEFKSQNLAIKNKKVDIFCEKMVDGIVDLYYVTVGNADKYYIQSENGLELLQPKKDTSFIYKGSMMQASIEPYKKTLARIFIAAPSLSANVDVLKYDHKEMISIVKKYHEITCDSIKCIDYTSKLKNLKMVNLELGNTFFRNKYVSSDDYVITNSPLFGISFIFKSARSGYQNYFKVGINYGRNNIQKRFETTVKSSSEFTIEIDENYRSVSMPIMLGKAKKYEKFTINYELGIINNFYIYKSSNYKLLYKELGGGFYQGSTPEANVRKPFKLGLEGGIFFQKNRFALGANVGYRSTVPRFGFYMDYITNYYVTPKVIFTI